MNFDHSLKSFLKRYSITIEMHSPFALRQTSREPQSHVLYFDVCNNSIYKGKAKRGCISSLISRKILFCKEQQLKAFQPQSSHKWCYTWTSIQLFCSSNMYFYLFVCLFRSTWKSSFYFFKKFSEKLKHWAYVTKEVLNNIILPWRKALKSSYPRNKKLTRWIKHYTV